MMSQVYRYPKELQAKAEELIEDHKRIMLKQLQDLETMSRKQQQVHRLETQIKSAQSELNSLREGTKALTGDVLFDDSEDDSDSDDLPH